MNGLNHLIGNFNLSIFGNEICARNIIKTLRPMLYRACINKQTLTYVNVNQNRAEWCYEVGEFISGNIYDSSEFAPLRLFSKWLF